MALIETSLPAEVLCAAEGEKLPADAALTLKSPGMEPCRACPTQTAHRIYAVRLLPAVALCSPLLYGIELICRYTAKAWAAGFLWTVAAEGTHNLPRGM